MPKETYKVYSSPISINGESNDAITMKKQDYDRLIRDLQEFQEYFIKITGYQTIEEYEKNQDELSKMYNNPSIGNK